METVHFVNASDVFNAIELGDFEQGQFLKQFAFGDSLTDLTLITKAKFLQRLTKFIVDCEDIYENRYLL